MHAESAGGRNLITISFTALLYGVVIDAALHRFHSLALTPANVLLVVALLIVIQDFFFYHEDMKLLNISFLKQRKAEFESMKGNEGKPAERKKRIRAEEARRRCEMIIFIFDVILLSTWYVLALAAQSTLRTYMIWLAVFFTSVAVWGQFCPKLDDPWPAPAHKEKAGLLARIHAAASRCAEALKDVKGLKKKYGHTHFPIAIFSWIVAIAAYNLVPDEVGRAHAAIPAGPSHEVGAEPAASWSPWYLILTIPLLAFTWWRAFVYWPYLKKRINRATRDDIRLAAPQGVNRQAEDATPELTRARAEIRDELNEMKGVLGSLVVCRFGAVGRAQDPVPGAD